MLYRLLCLLLITAQAAAAQMATARTTAVPPALEALRARIDRVLDDPDFDDAFWGVLVVDLTTGDTLYARDAQKNFIPASNQKLLATAAALDALGPDFRYTTGLYLDGVVTPDSTLTGHLVVRGSGDPTIGARFFGGDPTRLFRAWADSLKARGIARVTDHVIGDDDIFDDRELGSGWAWDDVPSIYAAELSGLSFNEGRVTLTVTGTSPGRRANLSWEPFQTDYVFFINRTETASGGVDREIRRERSGNTFWVETTVPPGRSTTHSVSVHNPTRYFAHTLREVLRQRGVWVDGDPVDLDDWRQRPDYERLERVATYTSPPLDSIVAVTNKDSNNLYAEHLLKTLGAVRCDLAFSWARQEEIRTDNLECGSAEAGLLAAAPLFERAGMDLDGMRLRDGSGMTHYNMIAPEDLVALLRHMWHHPNPAVTESFVQSLAVGGLDGTLRGRFGRGRARANVRAKTGTVTGARNLSGYVTTAAGTPLAFAILTNQFSTSTGRVTRAQDEIVELLAGYGR